MIKTYKSPKLTLAEDEVFMFGANLQGFHAGGAAGWATSLDPKYNWRTAGYEKLPDGTKGKWNQKGKLGPQVGTEGKSYALLTVTRAGAKRSISLSDIKQNIQDFYTFAKSRPHLKFFVAQENKIGLNGYLPTELAEIYSGDIPENVYFDSEFAKLLSQSGDENDFATKIVHCKKGKFSQYIGRPKAGGEWRFGNPFVISRDGDRPAVIRKMFQWLETGESFSCKDATPERRQWILDHVHELKGETLGCWCNYPKEDCHGRVLLEWANAYPLGNNVALNSDITENNSRTGMRVIVAGSRSITDYQLVCSAIKESGFKIAEIVSGTAKGVDKLGERWAKENNIPINSKPAPWDDIKDKPENEIGQNSFGKKYWKRAGAFRNQQMADYADALVAITTGSSGTADMIDRAKKKGLTIFIREVN